MTEPSTAELIRAGKRRWGNLHLAVGDYSDGLHSVATLLEHRGDFLVPLVAADSRRRLMELIAAEIAEHDAARRESCPAASRFRREIEK